MPAWSLSCHSQTSHPPPSIFKRQPPLQKNSLPILTKDWRKACPNSQRGTTPTNVGGKLSCFMPGHNPIFVQIIHLGCLLPHHNQQFVLTGRRFAEAASLWDKPWSVPVNQSDNLKDPGQNQSLSLKPPCARLRRASSLFIVETWHYQLHNVGFCDLAKTNMVWRGLKTTRQCLKAPLDSRRGARKMPESKSGPWVLNRLENLFLIEVFWMFTWTLGIFPMAQDQTYRKVDPGEEGTVWYFSTHSAKMKLGCPISLKTGKEREKNMERLRWIHALNQNLV